MIYRPLLDFTGRLIKEAPLVWGWGPQEKEKRRLRDHLDAITLLKRHDLCGPGVIGAYHARRVAPLMVHALPLYRMTLGAPLNGMALAWGALHDNEIVQRI